MSEDTGVPGSGGSQDEADERTTVRDHDEATVLRPLRPAIPAQEDDEGTVLRSIRPTSAEPVQEDADNDDTRMARKLSSAPDDSTHVLDDRTHLADLDTHIAARRAGDERPARAPEGAAAPAARLAVIPVDPASPLARERYEIRATADPVQAIRQDFSQPAQRVQRKAPVADASHRVRRRRLLLWLTVAVSVLAAGAVAAWWVL